MSEAPEVENEERPLPRSADDVLPQVVAPTAGFLLQLFLIPMTIVSIIVMVWLMFSWLAQMGNDPEELVHDLSRLNDASWQKALTLANLLRNPEYDELKRNHQVASELAGVLETQIDAGEMSDERIKLRTFLCRAIGEFQVDDGLPALILAATTRREPAETDVQRSAVQAIAVLAQNVGPESLRDNERLMTALASAATDRDARPDQSAASAELRATAAFTLGVIGGDAALETLEVMLDDPYANARYNAATGLARHGHLAAKTTILEMLDPDNESAVDDETSDSGRQWKRVLVLINGIRAAEQLFANADPAELPEITAALENLADSQQHPKVVVAAKETLEAMKASQP